MRTDVEFDSEGTTCAAWLYPAGSGAGPSLAIVMAHGFGGVREMDLPPFAEAFAAAGFSTLLFDYRYFGDSGGEPRQRLSPRSQLEDFRNAISWLGSRPEVDADRIGAWGTSFSGAHMLHLAAFESRVRAVVAQVPAASAWDNAKRIMDEHTFGHVLDILARERAARFAGGGTTYLPISAPPGVLCALPDAETRESLLHAAASAPTFRNEITLLSMEEVLEYAPAYTAHLIDRTPLLMIVAEHDSLTPVDLAVHAFDRVTAPKELVRLDVEHHGVYAEPARSAAVEHAVGWFGKHL